ncbi:MAG: hypothetical protein CW716_04010 [Candidatus Bathyarchaeum sp.]|nr:MAG: hypothetical protein CW716_04010 [Candidatus Bathyarchaeum sp.]
MKQTLTEIEENLKSRKETDRIMWFSMWAVLSVASFGIAWFPMMYYMIKRRNTHFQRQQKLEALILTKLKITPSQEQPQTKPLNAAAWTISTLLIVPAFYIFYVLKRDLNKHEEHEHDFLVQVIEYAKEKDVPLNLHGFNATPRFSLNKYVGLSIVSCGLAAAYWLYRIFNDYNSHIKMQWHNEEAILTFLKSVDENSS